MPRKRMGRRVSALPARIEERNCQKPSPTEGGSLARIGRICNRQASNRSPIASLPLRPIAGNMTARGTDRRAPGAQCDAGQMDPANGRIFQSGCVYGVLLRSSLSARPQDLRAYRKVVVRIGVSAHRRDDRNAKTHTSASLSRSVPRLPDKPPKCLITF